MNSQATKRWAVNVIAEKHLPLALFCDGRPLPSSPPTIADSISPVHYLLIAVASCFALSVRAVLSRHHLSANSFEVVGIGEKRYLPGENRLSQISVVAIFFGGLSESDAALITEQAKPLCTVTNTIFQTPVVQYTSRAVKRAALDCTNSALRPQSCNTSVNKFGSLLP